MFVEDPDIRTVHRPPNYIKSQLILSIPGAKSTLIAPQNKPFA